MGIPDMIRMSEPGNLISGNEPPFCYKLFLGLQAQQGATRPPSKARTPIPKFASYHGNPLREFRNQKSTSKYKGLVRLAPSGIMIPTDPK